MKPFICNNELCKDHALFFSGEEIPQGEVVVSVPPEGTDLSASGVTSIRIGKEKNPLKRLTKLPENGVPTCPTCNKSHRTVKASVIHLLVSDPAGPVESRFHEVPFKFGCDRSAKMYATNRGPMRYTHVHSAATCYDCLTNNPPPKTDEEE